MRFAPLFALAIFPSAAPLAFAQHAARTENVLVEDNFETNAGGWIAYGSSSAHLSVTHDPAFVRSGKGALMLDWEASGAKPGSMVLPVRGDMRKSLAQLRSLHFAMMAQSPSAIAVALQEKSGGRYLSVFWLEPHVWQPVDLAPADFHLGRNPGDPSDPDGKLDLDSLEAIVILDISQLLNASFAESSPDLAIVEHHGPQKLLLDDFALSSAPLPGAARAAGLIDRFDRTQIAWLTLGGAELRRDTGHKILSADALEAAYQSLEEQYVMLLHTFEPASDYAGATHLAFDVASEKPVHLAISFEQCAPGQAHGPRYTTEVELKGGNQPAHRQIALSAFELDTDGPPDPSGKLDLARVGSIAILDITGAYTGQTIVNTLRIANLELIKTAALPQ